jgi:hypothetical protein
VVEEQVDGAMLLAEGISRNVLRMEYLRGQEQQGAAYGCFTVENHIEPNLFREAAVQEFQFGNRMNGAYTILACQILIQYLPEGSKVRALSNGQPLTVSLSDT